MGTLTDMDVWKAQRRPVARTLCTQSETLEASYVRGITLFFAWQRVWLRAVLGV